MSFPPSFLRAILAVVVAALCASCAHSHGLRSSKPELHQVGLIWLKDAGNESDRRKIIGAVHEFGRKIPGVRSTVAGRTDGIGGPYSDTSYDLCFILAFENEAARQRYNEHPIHQKAATELFLPLSRKLLFYRFLSE